MSERRHDGPEQDRWTVPDRIAPGHEDLDVALGRLEDVLHELPYDRALPDLASILTAARITVDHLRADDRTLKVLHEAIVARPFHDIDEVASLRTEVELLTLEVGVLRERLDDPATSDGDVRRVTDRLRVVRRELDRLRDQL